MRARIAHAEGSPCPTLVLWSAGGWPEDRGVLTRVLTRAYGALRDRGAGHVLKIALAAPSEGPGADLAYRFVQVVPGAGPGGAPGLEFGGSCGHSVLSTVLAAAHGGALPPLRPGGRVRVRVLNNEDTVVCETLRAAPDGESAAFTVGFRRTAPTPLERTLPLGEPVSTVRLGGRRLPFSLVTLGNPYVFVDARHLGVPDERALFSAGAELFEALTGLRRRVARLLGWDSLCFPKVAALLPAGPGALAARAVSVPSWHPTLALTGATCLATAAVVDGTVPHRLAAAGPGGRLTVRTAAGPTAVRAATAADRLLEVTVSPKAVRLLSVLDPAGPVPHGRDVPAPSQP